MSAPPDQPDPAADRNRPAAAEAGAGAGAGRRLALTGVIAAVWCAGIGLATLTTITLIGWTAAPRTALGPGLPGVFRTAVTFWLVSHHAGFSLPEGRVGLLPLGLTLLPGALLFRGGGWIARVAQVRGRYRVGVVHAALAVAIPYSVLATLLAIVVRSPMVTPSILEALPTSFLLALAASGLGAARALVSSTTRRSPWAAMLGLLPDRTRSLVAGVTGATAVLLGSGALLFGISLAVHMSQARSLYDVLSPGIVGGILLFLIELVYLPNAVICAMAYSIGPGFAIGSGTSVAPSGVFLGVVPTFPPLAALPQPGPAPGLSLISLAAPFAAGVAGGIITMRSRPSRSVEAAPLWGLVCGVATGAVVAVLAVLSGGPLGGGRMATVGPSAWQVGLMATLEVGVAAAIAAWVTNWLSARRAGRADAAVAVPVSVSVSDSGAAEVVGVGDRVEFVEPEPVLASVELPPPLPDDVVPIEYGHGRKDD